MRLESLALVEFVGPDGGEEHDVASMRLRDEL